MKRRLFTFGCSFTNYFWPTWNSFLALDDRWDEYENWALKGIGNQAIFERLTECIATKNLTSSDTVIVQWSGVYRHDILHSGKGWANTGGLGHSKLFDSSWFDKFFDQEAYNFHTLTYIVAAQILLEKTNCIWRMTSMDDFKFFDTTRFIETGAADTALMDMNPSWRNKFEHIFSKNKDNWIEHIAYDDSATSSNLHKWYDESVDKEPWPDWHPTPLQSWSWARNSLLPSLGLKETELQQETVEEVEGFLKNLNKLDTAFSKMIEKFNWFNNQQKPQGYPT